MSDIDWDANCQWWTPTGWETRRAPPDETSGGPPDTSLHPLTRKGFDRMATFGRPERHVTGDFMEMRIDIWYSDDAYHVSMWAPDIELCSFYLLRLYQVQFFTQMLPGLLAGYSPWLHSQ